MDFNKLNDFIFTKMSKTFIPGISIAIFKDSKVVYSNGFGYRDLESALKATPLTLYEIGSVTKSFTALSIMQLMNKGELSLEDPVKKYVPINLESLGEPVRVWHLLTHSTGIPSLGYVVAIMRYATGCGGKWLPMANYDEFFTFMKNANEWAFTKPGERWFYFNEGYVILGYIIEKLSGMNYEKYVEMNILEPLGMTRTFFRRKDVEADQDVATPYIITRDGECKKSTRLYFLSSDGGLVSNVLDLARYVIMYLNRGQYEGNMILPANLVEEMENPKISLPLQMFGGEAYSFGFSVIPNFFGCKVVGHGGGGYRSRAYIGYVPEKKVGITILSNGAGYPLSHISLYTLCLLMEKDPENLPFIRMERTFEAITGIYQNYMGTLKAQVVQRNGLLCIEIACMKDRSRDTIVPLIPEKIEGDNKIFYAPQIGGKLTIEFIHNGENVDLIYERYRLKKVGNL